MRDRTIFIIIIIILVAYFLFTEDSSSDKQDYKVPPEYRGKEGLDYIKRTYSSELSQARSLCINQFKGNWIDTSNDLGCYNMQGFSSSYCNMDILKNLANLCRSIGGNSICSSTQASCTV
ncbi:MAG: hypothetical protein GTN36_02495 [Candidatus Aenigmarchaeota archaeon]|nr:hypothetical protein [Candidatus Aenigmarchaeota archaeon]